MRMDQVLQFVQLAIQHFRPGMLMIWGDHRIEPSLLANLGRLEGNFLLTIRSYSPGDENNTRLTCEDCPANRLHIIDMAHPIVNGVMKMIQKSYNAANRIIVVRSHRMNDKERRKLIDTFYGYNLVLLETHERRNMRVLTWGNQFSVPDKWTTFDGPPDAIFRSDHPYALMFRQQFRQFNRGGAMATAAFMTTRIAPFHCMVQNDEDTRRPADNRQMVASAHVALIRLVGTIMHFSVDTVFMTSRYFVQSAGALALAKQHRRVAPLFEYDKNVFRKIYSNIRAIDMFIHQTCDAASFKTMTEIRRFVAIVPYRASNTGSVVIVNALVNLAVLLFWFGGAALFAGLLVQMRWITQERNVPRWLADSHVTIFFRCLAAVLGNSCGSWRSVWRAELFVQFVIGVFATLTGMLFTGALFEQFLAVEVPRQIDTMAELNASRLPVFVADGDMHYTSSFTHSEIENIKYMLVEHIEVQLLAHNTSVAFVLPELIADIVEHPALQFANGTPVYHIVAKPFGDTTQFLTISPAVMQRRFVGIWQRLVESGIDAQLRRQYIALYKAIRRDRLRAHFNDEASHDEDGTVGSSEIILLLLVLGCGTALAGIAFLVEVWTAKKAARRVFPLAARIRPLAATVRPIAQIPRLGGI